MKPSFQGGRRLSILKRLNHDREISQLEEMLPGARSLLSTRVMHTTKYSLAESRGQVKLGGLFLNQIYPRQCTVDKITVRVPRRHDNARWGVSREIAFGKKERKIPLITFLIFEEPDVPLKRGMGKSLIFEEPNPFRVY